MIKEIYNYFGEDAYHVLKKYQGQAIRVTKHCFLTKPIAVDFINIFGMEKTKRFFQNKVNYFIRITNHEAGIKLYLKKQIDEKKQAILMRL